MDSRVWRVFQKELTCPICKKYFIDPVTIDCGHSFCRPCLYLCWQETSDLSLCLKCKRVTRKRDYKTDISIKNLAVLARKASLLQFLSSEEHTCVVHKETKKIFCQENRNLLCVLCSDSQEHQGHRHLSVDQAAEEHRETLLKTMECLWKNFCENSRNMNMEIIKTRSWEDYVDSRREAIRNVFQKMPLYLQEEEQHHWEILYKERREIFEQLNESQARMAHKRETLRGMYKELKEMCHKPDVELLQAFGDILPRCESMLLHMPQPVNPELSAVPITGLIETLRYFQVTVTLDPERFNQHMFLQGDLRSLHIGCFPHDVPCLPERPGCFLAWGGQTFTSGRYYWEVEVGNSCNWAVGVCNGFWKEKYRNTKTFVDEGLFLIACVKEDAHYSFFTTSPLLVQYVARPINRIGLFLDYEARTMSFLDVDHSSLIYTIPSCYFSIHLKPIFCCCHL
uniref:Tripartite motif containing 77 n=1 Tax=Oryctolagus cuniculus TaxID=9986 RepID=G1TAE1_RABIT